MIVFTALLARRPGTNQNAWIGRIGAARNGGENDSAMVRHRAFRRFGQIGFRHAVPAFVDGSLNYFLKGLFHSGERNLVLWSLGTSQTRN